MTKKIITKDLQYFKFCTYGFLKNLRFFEPFLILFFIEKGLNFTQIGVLYSIREIAKNIFEIPSGVMADIFGRRRTMILSFISYIFSFFIYYFSEEFYVFILAVIVFGFGDAFRTGTHKAMIFEYLKIHKREHLKTHYYGHTRSWSQRGSAISSVLAAFFVIYNRNYSIIFLFSTIPYFLDLINISTYPKKLDGGYREQLSKTTIKQSFTDAFISLKNSLIKKNSIRCISNVSIFSGFYMAVKDYIQPIIMVLALEIPLILGMDEKQQTAVFIGIVYFIIYNLTALASRFSGKVTDKKGSSLLNLTLTFGFLSGILSGILYGFNLIVLSIIFFIGIYIVQNLRKPSGVAFISEKFDDKVLASALSVASQTETLFGALFAFILGLLADLTGLKWAILILSGFLFLLHPLIFVKREIN